MKYPRWVKTLLATPASERLGWVEEIINGLKEYRKKHKLTKDEVYLSEFLTKAINSGEYEIVGFSPGTEYIKVEGPEDELNCVWQHEHMNPGLLLKPKHLPILIIVGPALRKDSSILNETGIRRDGVRGLTGP